MLCLLALIACNDNQEECNDDDLVFINDYSPSCKYEDPFFDENSSLRKELNYEGFFNTYFSVPSEIGFSLDEDINVFHSFLYESNKYIVYTKNRKVNLAWASDCKMTEKISPEQMSEINLLEEKIKTSHHFKHNCMSLEEISLYEWKGRLEKGSLKFYMIMSEFLPHSKLELNDFFEQKVFTHGCKEHAAEIKRKEQVEKFRQGKEYQEKLQKEIDMEIKKYQSKYGNK